MKETLLDQFSPSGKNRLDTLTLKKKTSVMLRASDGTMQQQIKEIKIPYEVPCVTPGIRFLYYLVDLIFWFGITMIAMMIVLTTGLISEQVMEQTIVSNLFASFFMVLYYMLEAVNGKSLAKLFFGYTVINVYAEKVTGKEAFIRSISRLVPFEAFSCFGNPSRGWHDKWAGTYVVADKDLSRIYEALETE